MTQVREDKGVGKREAIAIAAIALGALALRLAQLNSSLWYDEIITLMQSIRLAPADLLTTYGSLNNHVLYSWLAKGSVALFGESPFALRLPAVLFGVASLIAAWRLYRSPERISEALLVALLLALSFHHVWFSQNARGYTGLLLFSLLSSIWLGRAMAGPGIKNWIIFGVMIGLSMLVHLSAAFFIAAQGLYVLGARLMAAKSAPQFFSSMLAPTLGFSVGAAITLIVFAPMIGGVFSTVGEVSARGAGLARQVAEWKNPLWTIIESVRSFGVLGYLAPVAALFIGLGSVRLCRLAPAAAVPFLIHIPLTIVVLMALSMRVWPRYFFLDIAFLFAALVFGAFWFADIVAGLMRRAGVPLTPKALKIIGSMLMVAASLPLLATNYKYPKQDFDGALTLIEQGKAPSDTVAVIGLAGVYFDDFRRRDFAQPESVAEFDALAGGGGPEWAVAAFPAHTRAYYPEIQQRLDGKFDLVRRFRGTLSGGDVDVYRRRED